MFHLRLKGFSYMYELTYGQSHIIEGHHCTACHTVQLTAHSLFIHYFGKTCSLCILYVLVWAQSYCIGSRSILLQKARVLEEEGQCGEHLNKRKNMKTP
jgi:hypothetical protein